jgi:(S)-3,5-dihydroxyphenylglycine transaminase
VSGLRALPAGVDLLADSLHESLQDPALESMNFLNEIAMRYPDAISFASGRPCEEFFDVGKLHAYLDRYCRHLERERGLSAEQVRRLLFQYGRTKGIVHELIARHLAVDEGMTADPESIVVTVGCQEAMFCALRALRRDEHDILLAIAPTYVGLTGAARLADLPVWGIRSGPSGIDLGDFRAQCRRAREAGLRPRGCYVMPDFANPTGVSLSLPVRHRLLETAAQEGVLLLEDNPYGLFHDGRALPTMKALDTRRQVIYLGSFAKTGFPGARVGYVVADQRVAGPGGEVSLLADHLARIKSMLTVNTSPVAQALVGGKLLEHDCCLARANERETGVYRRNLRRLLDGLAARFGGPQVSWNSPRGGFFAVVTVPFAASDGVLERSAREYGVLWTPMHHFYAGGAALPQLRLACSQVTPAQIEAGLDRFAALVSDLCAAGCPVPARKSDTR